MKPMMCFDSISAGLFLDGEVAILSFLTNGLVNDTDATVVLSREMLESLNGSIHRALVRSDRKADRAAGGRRLARAAGGRRDPALAGDIQPCRAAPVPAQV